MIKVAAYQFDSVWENPSENLKKLEKALENCTADILVLPEMFATGYSMTSENIAETMEGEIVSKLTELALKHNKAITASVAIREKESSKFVNRLIFVDDKGKISFYDKRHLFRMAGEQNHYKSGEKRVVVEFRGIRILLQVCYDLRFPVFSRQKGDYDAIIYVASWGEKRSYPWSTLLRARAIENQAFVIGCNRCGKDPKEEYSGNTVILDYMGKPIAEAVDYKEEIITAELDTDAQNKFRESFPAFMDADKFEII